MAPVELVGLARRKAQRHIGVGGRGRSLALPTAGVAPDRVVAACVAKTRAAPRRPGSASDAHAPTCPRSPPEADQFVLPRTDLRLWLHRPFVLERRRTAAHHLPNDLPRDPQFAADRLDRLPLNKIARDGSSRSSPQPASQTRPPMKLGSTCGPLRHGGPVWTPITPKTGSLFHADLRLNASSRPCTSVSRMISASLQRADFPMSIDPLGRHAVFEQEGLLVLEHSRGNARLATGGNSAHGGHAFVASSARLPHDMDVAVIVSLGLRLRDHDFHPTLSVAPTTARRCGTTRCCR